MSEQLIFARFERTIKRLWILCIILIVALIATNSLWIYYESQWAYVDTTSIEQDVEQETTEGGNNIFVGGDYGTTESENDNN